MIQVTTLHGLQPQPSVQGNVVILEDGHGNPFFVAYELAAGKIECVSVQDKNFVKTLRQLGIDKLVVCDKLCLPQPPNGAKAIIVPASGAVS